MAFLKAERAKGDVPKAIADVLQSLYKTDAALQELMQPEPEEIEIVIPDDLSFPPLPESVQFSPEVSAGAFPYLDKAVAFSKKASPEAYEDYHPFIIMWMLSVANARRSYLPIGLERIYGNLMIGLFGRSSLFAKSFTAKTAKKILIASGLGYLLGPDKPSPSKLLSNMAGAHIPIGYSDWNSDDKEAYHKKLGMSGQKGLYFDELGKLLQGMLRKGSTTSEFADMFLTLDNCEESYVPDTHARGAEPIIKPYLALIGAITPPNLQEMAKSGSASWNDGLFGRMSFVAAPPNAYIDAPLSPGELAIPDDLTRPLREWHQRLGVPLAFVSEIMEENKRTGRYQIERQELQEHACTIEQEATLAWHRYRSVLKRMISEFPHEDFASSYARLPEIAMRMAILMASLCNNGRIELKHWAKAQELAELLRKNLHELYRQVNNNVGQSATAKLEDIILTKMRYLRDKGMDGITIVKLQSSYLKNNSIKEITDTLEALVKGGSVEKKKTNHAPNGKYFLI
jgi:hypothetical protein